MQESGDLRDGDKRTRCSKLQTSKQYRRIDERYRHQIQQLIESYKPKQGNQISVETKIILQDEMPVSLKPRRLAVREKAILNAQLEDWLRDGVVQPSSSRYSSPVIIVPKKNGTYRVCVDYRQLNRKILRDRFPVPLIEDRIDALLRRVVSTPHSSHLTDNTNSSRLHLDYAIVLHHFYGSLMKSSVTSVEETSCLHIWMI